MQASATPTKDFFVNMITRDISLEDCILDLLDNCIDGARKSEHKLGKTVTSIMDFKKYKISIAIKNNEFAISDNCGGMSIEEASGYAFNFGKKKNTGFVDETEFGIGLYGIGMKRSIFKIAKKADIYSCNGQKAFVVNIDVDQWLKDDNNWWFELTEQQKTGDAGTNIIIKDLRTEVSREFSDPVFTNKLNRIIARDYSIFLQHGLSIKLNDIPVKPYNYRFKQGDNFLPASIEYTEDDVVIRITAGLASQFEDDVDAEKQAQVNVEYFGWFVSCNNRIVLPADKTEKTVWGDNNFRKWHPQLNGFMGIVDFSSKDSSKLPWNTTKRDLNIQNHIYRKAIVKMKEVTNQYIQYSNARKTNLASAKNYEARLQYVSFSDVRVSPRMLFPTIEKSTSDLANIQYKVLKERLNNVKESFKNTRMSGADVGLKTFDYYYKSEIGED